MPTDGSLADTGQNHRGFACFLAPYKDFCKISAAAEVKLKGGRWAKESEVLIPWEN